MCPIVCSGISSIRQATVESDALSEIGDPVPKLESCLKNVAVSKSLEELA